MSPIDKVSDIRRLPLLGNIRLGIKKEGRGTTYPQAVDYFVSPEEVQAVYGERPKELKIMFPSDDLELVAPQYYKCYSYSQGLICRGTGKECVRKVDAVTNDFANKATRQWVLSELECDPEHCPMIGAKQCRRMMSLFFILYDVPGLGVYRLNTSSFYSIVNINSQLAPDAFLRNFTQGRIAFIPLVLYLKPQEVTPAGEGRKTVHVLNVRADVKLADIIRISRQRPAQVLLPTLADDEVPEDLYPEEVIGEAEVVGGEKALAEPAEVTEPTPAEPAPPKKSRSKKAAAPPEAEPHLEPEAEAVNIDLVWLNETLDEIRWDEDTLKSWIVWKFKDVNTEGKITDVLGRLTRDQAEVVIQELQSRAGTKQPGLL